jgi:putative ABC transport system permease protein
MSTLLRRIIHLLGQRRHETDLRDEIEAHRSLRQAQLERDGMSAGEAERASRRALGSVALATEDTRGVWLPATLEGVWQDIRFAARSARANLGFTTVVVLTLALGVGATVAMFSVVNTVLWRALPYPDADRLVVIDRALGRSVGGRLEDGEILALRANSRTLTLISAANGAEAFLTVGDEMEHVTSASATDDMLALLGAARLPLGRRMDATEDVRDESVTGVVISERLWRRALGGDPRVVGRRIEINNRDMAILGVLPPAVRTWLPAVMGMDEHVDVWYPKALENRFRASEGGIVIARLTDGATLAEASTELDLFARRFMTDQPAAYAASMASGALRFRVRRLHDVVTAPVARGLWSIGGAVAFVFLIGCVNVANLMVARAHARQREMAIRTTLGAGRRRMFQQLAIEHAVLAAVGAALGLVLARAGVDLVAWLRPAHLPRQSEIGVDLTSAAIAVGLGATATILCGMFPVLDLLRSRDGRSLTSTRSSVSLAGGRRLQRSLVVAEVALSIVPLVAAGLMLRSFVNLTNAPLGFDPAGVVTATVPYSHRFFENTPQVVTLYRGIVADVARLPGVHSVSGAFPLPFEYDRAQRFRSADDPADQGVTATEQGVLPGYLRLTGVQLVRGRDVTDDDLDAERDVVVVDERFADAVFGGNAVGRRIHRGSGGPGTKARELEVIGVTRAVRMARVRDEPLPHVFLPYHLFPIDLRLVVKTDQDAATIGPLIKRTAEAHGTRRAVHDIQPMSASVAESINDTRFTMLILIGFAAISVLLAAVGLYGTLAYLISQRRQEFGVRLAVGAAPHQIVALVAREGGLLTSVGAILGLAGAFAATGMLRGLLFGVAPSDPVTLASVCGLVALVAVVAVIHPAWRASRVDPNLVLRVE